MDYSGDCPDCEICKEPESVTPILIVMASSLLCVIASTIRTFAARPKERATQYDTFVSTLSHDSVIQ